MGRLSHVADAISVGDRFGRWVVVGPYYRLADGSAVFSVECDCGSRQDKRLKYLRNGDTKSCGCLQRDVARGRKRRVDHLHLPYAAGDRRGRYLWSEYKLTAEQYDAMYDAQGGRCAICSTSFGESRVVVDHDHETGAVRALLCSPCNTGIGHLREDEEIMRKAIDYLAFHKATREFYSARVTD